MSLALDCNVVDVSYSISPLIWSYLLTIDCGSSFASTPDGDRNLVVEEAIIGGANPWAASGAEAATSIIARDRIFVVE